MRLLRYSLAAALCALLVPAAAHGSVVVNNNGPQITMGDNQNGSPYPSNLIIQGGDGSITRVEVVVNLEHNAPDDVDLALVSPTGHASLLMSDACGGTGFTNRTFLFTPLAPAAMPDAGPCPGSQGYLASDYLADVPWPAPAPSSITIANLNNFIGHNPNGVWQLFARDDASFPAPPAGVIRDWGLVINTNTADIVIPATPNTLGIANPYPATKTVDVPDGRVIDDVNLNITGFNHMHPADVDMLLAGPSGSTVMAMSDACGFTDINTSFNWTIDDEAPLSFTENFANCRDPALKPTDLGTPPEQMPAPAPARPYGTTMSVFDGLQGGDFRLFINDSGSNDTGYINGWNVTAATRPAAATGFAATAVSTAEGQSARLTVNRTGPANLGPATVNVAVNHIDTNASDIGAATSSLTFARGETSKTIDIPIVADFQGEDVEAFFVGLSNATNDALLTDATSFATVTIARSEPDNRFTVGQAVRKRNGSAYIPVTIPFPGQLTSDDAAGAKNRLNTTDAFPETGGTTTLKLKPAKGAKRKLRRGKKVNLTAAITYIPLGGSANSAEAPVSLKKKFN